MTERPRPLEEIFRRYRLEEPARAAGDRRVGFHPLPMRVEMLWRREGFSSCVAATIHVAYRLHFRPDRGRLRNALVALMMRHEPLRTSLHLVDDAPRQAVHGETALGLELCEASSVDEAIAEFVTRPFDLSAPPLFRAGLFRGGDDDEILVLTMHHYVSDALSLYALWEELWRLYQAAGPGSLDAVGPQYVDYAHWQREEFSAKAVSHCAQWAKKLDGYRPFALAGAAAGSSSGELRFQLPAELIGAAKAGAKALATPLFPMLLAPFQAAVASWAGVADVVTAVPVAARLRPDFRNTIGYLINAAPIRARTGGEATKALAAAVSKEIIEGLFLQDISYELVEPALVSRPPLCSVMFNFIPAQVKPAGATPGPATPYASKRIAMRVAAGKRFRIMDDFVFYIQESDGGGAGIAILYNSERFSERDVSRFFQLYERKLAALVS